jgi:hypothetical protein
LSSSDRDTEALVALHKWPPIPSLGRREIATSALKDGFLLAFGWSVQVGYKTFLAWGFDGALQQFGNSWALQLIELMFDVGTVGTCAFYVLGDVAKAWLIVAGRVLAYWYLVRSRWRLMNGGT